MAKVKKPMPPKIPRPKTKDLRAVLKGIVTTSVTQRIATLCYMIQWYDGAINYLAKKGRLPANAAKLLDLAMKCRKQEQGTDMEHEKDAALLKAVQIYEKVCVALKPPQLEKSLELYRQRKEALEKRQQKMEQKFFVLPLLQKGINNRVKLEVCEGPKLRQYDPQMTVLSYNREAAKQLSEKFRKEGLLAVFFSELDVLSQKGALTQAFDDGKLKYTYSAEDDLQATRELLQSFLAFAKTSEAPKRLVRPGYYTTPVPKAPKAPTQGAQTGFHKGPRVGGILIPGTNVAILYERLKDEQERELAEVLQGIQSPNPIERIHNLRRSGERKGMWTVTITGNKVRLIHTPQPQQAASV